MEKETSAKGKIQEICDILKKETIEPAKQEAAEVVENAHMQADEIVKNAEKKANELLEKTKKEVEEEKRTFTASLNLSMKQSLDTVRQKIEKELFSNSLKELLSTPAEDPKVLAELINAIVTAIEKEGTDVDLSASVGKTIPAKKVAELLLASVRERLRDGSVEVGDFEGGVQVKMQDKDITVDISEEALKDMIATFVRKEFREMVFQA